MSLQQQIAIADLAGELADSYQHREPRWGWSESRHRIPLDPHITVQPGLLVQLYGAVRPALSSIDDSGSRGVPKSCPPLQLDALDRYLEICTRAREWLDVFDLKPRDTPEANLRALAGAHHGDDGADLLADLRRWRGWAATMTGWQSIYTPRAACPVVTCGATGTLRINLDRQTGICTACRSWWDEDTIQILGAHIANTTDGYERVRVRSGWSGHGGWASRATQGAAV